MNKKKYHVFFRRVSSKGQDLAMQVQADKPFREKFLPEEVLTFNEYAVSANKVPMEDRDELLQVISLIKKGQVDTLYAFDNSRIFRDTYEANFFTQLRKDFGFYIFYTKDHQYVPSNFLHASMGNLMSDIEGKNIARRTQESGRMYPPKKFGYIKEVKEGKQYKKDPKVKDTLNRFLNSLLSITNNNEMFELLAEYRKELNRTNEELIKSARDPFYAGYDLSKGKNKLIHVEPYLNLETYNSIQTATSLLFDEYLIQIEDLYSQDKFTPLCGYCHQPLLFRIDKQKNVSFYTCSRSHKRNRISTSHLEGTVELVLQEVAKKLDTDNLLKQTNFFFKASKKKIDTDMKLVQSKIDQLMHDCFMNEYKSNWKENTNYQKLTEMKEIEEGLLKNLSITENQLQKNKVIIDMVTDYLTNSSKKKNPLSSLYPLFIYKIVVEENEIHVELWMSDFLKAMKDEFIYGGDSA